MTVSTTAWTLYSLLALAASPREYEGPTTLAAEVPAPEAATPAPEPAPAPAVAADEVPTEEVLTEEVPTEPLAGQEEEDAIEVDGGRERTVVVSTNLLGDGKRIDAFRHVGGRSIVGLDDASARGFASIGEALQASTGVRVLETGASGIGSVSTKLNVGVRGANPKLSKSATVMLDEIPLQPAPYGQPELSLFPVSMFTIARVDTVRGGATVRFGPRTSGGVINLVSKPIPENPTLSVFAQSDHFGDAAVATSYGGTHRKLGMYFEYAPRFGRSFREHSEFQAHGGLIKLSYPVTSKFSLLSTTHLFYERSNLPGGLYRFQFDENRLQSVRESDYFEGSRVGTALRGRWRPKDDHELQVLGWYNYTDRMSVMRDDRDREWAEAPVRNFVPRSYNVFGAESRYAFRVDSPKRRLFQDFTFGARAMYEIGTDQRCIEFLDELGTTKSSYQLRDEDIEPCVQLLRRGIVDEYDNRVRLDNDGRYAGYALFADDKLHLLDGKMAIYGGLRLELMNFGIRNNLAESFIQRFLVNPSPAVSIWGTPRDEVSLFISYGRSLGAPSFKIADASATEEGERFELETINQFELGVKLLELQGVYLELTGWYRDIHNMVDSGLQSSDLINGAWASGAESDLSWAPGDIWEPVEGLEFNVGYAFTYSRITDSNSPGTVGNLLAWYPIHEAWGGISQEFPWGLRFGTNVYWQDEQFTDYANTESEDDQPSGPAGGAGVGKIPGYARWDAYLGVRRAVGARLATRLEFTLGVKNILDAEYFFRSDDTNAGLYAGRPRTFYINFGISHEFAKRRRRATTRRRTSRQRFWDRSRARAQYRLYRGTATRGAQGVL